MSEQTAAPHVVSTLQEGLAAVMWRTPQAISRLPHWAQVLISARMLQRFALALRQGSRASVCDLAEDVAAAMRRCARYGGGSAQHHGLFEFARHCRERADVDAAIMGDVLRAAVDATQAAEAAPELAVDAAVSHAALRAIDGITEDPRVGTLQVRILLASDIDQLRFNCSTLSLGTCDALPEDLFQRLTPVHALTLMEPRSSAEAEYR